MLLLLFCRCCCVVAVVVAVAAAGAALPAECLGRDCRDAAVSPMAQTIVQQKEYRQNGAQKCSAGGSHSRLWARSSGRRCSVGWRSLDGCPIHARVIFFCFDTRGHTIPCVFPPIKRLAIYFQNSRKGGDSGIFLGTLFFWRPLKLENKLQLLGVKTKTPIGCR